MKALVFVLLIVLVALAQCKIWDLCGTAADTLTVKDIAVIPDPPQSGAQFNVTIFGVLAKQISGGNIHVKVQYDSVDLFEGDLDLCTAFDGAMHCPVTPSTRFQFNIVQTIPPIAPAGGPYTGTINITDQDRAVVTCVSFKFEMQDPSAAAAGNEDLTLYSKLKQEKLLRNYNNDLPMDLLNQ